MRPDYQRIAQLEFELGFSDVPPPPVLKAIIHTRTADAILKDVYTRPVEGFTETAWRSDAAGTPPRDRLEADWAAKARGHAGEE